MAARSARKPVPVEEGGSSDAKVQILAKDGKAHTGAGAGAGTGQKSASLPVELRSSPASARNSPGNGMKSRTPRAASPRGASPSSGRMLSATRDSAASRQGDSLGPAESMSSSSLASPSQPSRMPKAGGATSGELTASQSTKQEAERLRREQGARLRDELEMFRQKAKNLESENARLAQEMGIWKNAQTAASALLGDMEKLRAAHAKLKLELVAQVAENAKLKRERLEVRDEMKRMKALVANAEKNRATPSVVATGDRSLINHGDLGSNVSTAQQQLAACLIMQRAVQRWKQRKVAGKSVSSIKATAVAQAQDQLGTSAVLTAESAVGKQKGGQPDAALAGGRSAGYGSGVGALMGCDKFSTNPHVLHRGFHGLQLYKHGSLEQFVGTPSIDIDNAIEREHASEQVFSSQNVQNTTPKREYLYVTRMEVGTLLDRRLDAGASRSGWQLEDFEQHDSARAALLLREEVVAARLYTGPMYVIYNDGVLRKGVQGQYVTTLHAINSAVLKLSKLQTPSTVYRGVAGGVLPSTWFEPSASGVVGGFEVGFMSTSLDRAVALDSAQRSQVGDGRTRLSMLLQIKLGLADTGASLEFLSQFPNEKEIALPPLTGLEVVSKPWVEGTTLIVDLRPQCNISDRTIEHIVGKMKCSHLDLLDSMRDELIYAGAPQRAMLSLTGLRQESAARPAEEFNLAKTYRTATERALAAQEDVMDFLGEDTPWDGEPGTPKEIAERMMKVITLQARAGHYDFASQLLFQAIAKDPLPSDLEQKMNAAERSLMPVGVSSMAVSSNRPVPTGVLALALLSSARSANTPHWSLCVRHAARKTPSQQSCATPTASSSRHPYC